MLEFLLKESPDFMTHPPNNKKIYAYLRKWDKLHLFNKRVEMSILFYYHAN